MVEGFINGHLLLHKHAGNPPLQQNRSWMMHMTLILAGRPSKCSSDTFASCLYILCVGCSFIEHLMSPLGGSSSVMKQFLTFEISRRRHVFTSVKHCMDVSVVLSGSGPGHM